MNDRRKPRARLRPIGGAGKPAVFRGGAGRFRPRDWLADIAAGYALDYLDFALPEVEWRKAHPALARLAARLAARKSFSGTAHVKNA